MKNLKYFYDFGNRVFNLLVFFNCEICFFFFSKYDVDLFKSDLYRFDDFLRVMFCMEGKFLINYNEYYWIRY